MRARLRDSEAFLGGTVRHVRVQASPEVVRLIQERGGKLYVSQEIDVLRRLADLPRDLE